MSSARIVLIVLVIVVIGAIAFGVWWWIDYQNSPRYSIGQLVLAMNAGDWERVQRYMDVDAVTEDIADRIVEERLESSGIELEGLGRQLAEAAKPLIAEQVEAQMRRRVERRSGRTGVRERIGAIWYTRDPKRLDVANGIADVTVELPIEGRSRELQMQMQRSGEIWRVVRLENPEVLLGQGQQAP